MRSKINFLVGPQNLLRRLSRDGDLHDWDVTCATTVSPKLSFRAPRKMSDAVVGGGKAEWTTSKSGHESLLMPELLAMASCRKD